MRIATAVVGVSAFALYASTLAPDVGPVDSGELTLAAWELGIPHPPGFPLYVLLTHVLTLVPFGSVAVRANLASALFAAIAIAMTFRLTLLVASPRPIAERSSALKPPKGRSRSTSAATEQVGWEGICGATAAAFLLACTRTMWAYATVAEVYALAAGLIVTIWVLMLQPGGSRMRPAAALFGLALGAHPALIVTLLPALGLCVVLSRGLRFFATREFVVLLLLAVIGAAIYGYLPLAARESAALNWGDPRTLDRFWAHVSGWQYRGAYVVNFDGLVEALRRFAAISAGQLGAALPLGLALVLVGLVETFRRSTAVLAVLVTWMGTSILTTAALNAGWVREAVSTSGPSDDLDAYYLPVFAACAALAGVGVAALLRASGHGAGLGVRRAAVGLFVAGALLQPLVTNWHHNNRRGDFVSRSYVDDVLRSVNVGGLLLVRDWNLSSPMLYVQHAEGRRSDAVVLDLNLLERRWYAESAARRYPAVFDPARQALGEFLQLAAAWEQDPSSIQRDSAYRMALGGAYDTLVMTLVGAYLQHAPVFVTLEVATARDGKADALAKLLRSQFQLIPQGLVFDVRLPRASHAPAPVVLHTGPLSALVREKPEHVAIQRIAAVYRDMLISRALYVETTSSCAQATPAFAQALAIDPRSAAATAGIARCSVAPAR